MEESLELGETSPSLAARFSSFNIVEMQMFLLIFPWKFVDKPEPSFNAPAPYHTQLKMAYLHSSTSSP